MMKHMLIVKLLIMSRFVETAVSKSEWSDSKVHEIVLPTDMPPADLEDDWDCALMNIDEYFDPPKPTGALLTSMDEYEARIFTEACTLPKDEMADGCWLDKDQVCGFTTAINSKFSSELSSYGSAASSWWAAHSSNAVWLATKCPNQWMDSKFAFPAGDVWLNDTIMYAACHDEKYGTNRKAESKSSPTTLNQHSSTAVPGHRGAKGEAIATSQPGKSGSGSGRWTVDLWIVIGGCVIAGVASCGL